MFFYGKIRKNIPESFLKIPLSMVWRKGFRIRVINTVTPNRHFQEATCNIYAKSEGLSVRLNAIYPRCLSKLPQRQNKRVLYMPSYMHGKCLSLYRDPHLYRDSGLLTPRTMILNLQCTEYQVFPGERLWNVK